MKKILTIIGVLLAVAGISTAVILAPGIAERQRIAQSRIAPYSVDNYVGWGLAYNAIQEANSTLYSPASKNKKSEDYLLARSRGWPEKNLPDLIEEFGIVVQKDYASNYIFVERKGELLEYTGKLLSDLKQAQNSYSDSSKPANANDANVRAALDYYYTLFEKLQNSINDLKLEEAKSGSLGERIQKDVGEAALSKPLAYGQVAEEYLLSNIERYKGLFENRTDYKGDFSNEVLTKVEAIAGIE